MGLTISSAIVGETGGPQNRRKTGAAIALGQSVATMRAAGVSFDLAGICRPAAPEVLEELNGLGARSLLHKNW
jgi:hypothetical protein